MSVESLLLAIPLVLVFWLVQLGIGNARRARWNDYAKARGLHGGRGSTTRLFAGNSGFSRLFGVFEGTIVCLTEERRGSGKSKYTVTKASAFFSLPLPAGLHVTTQGLGASFVVAFGGQDLIVGQPDTDAALRIQATDEEATRALFAYEAVRKAVADFVADGTEARITQSHASFLRRGFVTDPDALDEMLRKVAHAVRSIESALAVSPADDDAEDRERSAVERYPLPQALREPAAEPSPSPARAAGKPAAAAPTDPSAAPSSAAAAIVADLVAGGRVESVGAFTLDRATAREKLRQFRLREPEEYVLPLVRCAVLKGARTIEFRIDADDLRLTFDGRPFGLADFEELYGALFAVGDDAELRARRQLALAVNAAEALEPRFLRIASGDASGTVTFEAKPGEPDRFGPAAEGPHGTEIHVKSRLLDSLGRRRGRTVELLRTRCTHAPVPVSVNGTVVSHGPLPAEAFGTVEVTGPGFHGGVGLRPDAGSGGSRVTWVTDGVVAATHALNGRPTELQAVVEGSARLHLDASQGDVVRDEAHAQLVAAVWAALPRVYRRLGAQLADAKHPSTLPRRWARDVLRSLARGFPDTAAFRPGGPARWLAELPLFQDVELADVTLAELLDRVESGGTVGRSDYALTGLGIAPGAPRCDKPDPGPIVWIGWLHNPRSRALLHRLLGDRLRDATERLLACPRDPELLDTITSRAWS